MNINYLDKSGILSFDDFLIDETMPLEKQLGELKEDMLQIEFPGGYTLDIGWRPSFSINGEFKVALIKNFNWTKPIFFQTTKDIASLENLINKAIQEVQ